MITKRLIWLKGEIDNFFLFEEINSDQNIDAKVIYMNMSKKIINKDWQNND